MSEPRYLLFWRTPEQALDLVRQLGSKGDELGPTVAAVAAPVESVAAVLVDTGFYSEAAVQAVEQTPSGQPTGTTVYAAMEKKEHQNAGRCQPS